MTRSSWFLWEKEVKKWNKVKNFKQSGKTENENFESLIDSLKLAVLKNKWIAEQLGGKVFDVVAKFDQKVEIWSKNSIIVPARFTYSASRFPYHMFLTEQLQINYWPDFIKMFGFKFGAVIDCTWKLYYHY